MVSAFRGVGPLRGSFIICVTLLNRTLPSRGIEAGNIGPLASPVDRLEEMVLGSPIPGSSTTLLSDTLTPVDVEPVDMSELSPIDRFVQIVQAATTDADEDVQVEGMLHPVHQPRHRKPGSRKGLFGTAAFGLFPSVALISQVLVGARLKADVLGDGLHESGDGRLFASCVECALPDSDTGFSGVVVMECRSVVRALASIQLGCYCRIFCTCLAFVLHFGGGNCFCPLVSSSVVDAPRVSTRCGSFEEPPTGRSERMKAALTSKTAMGITAALAAFGALYFLRNLYARRKKKLGVGMLVPSTAKWDLKHCLLILDVAGAQAAGHLGGRYVTGSVEVEVHTSTQHGILTYRLIPSLGQSLWKFFLRKQEVVHEHFYLPTDYCYISSASAATEKRTTSAGGGRATTPAPQPASYIREFFQSKSWNRHSVTGIVLQAEKTPGLQLIPQAEGHPPLPPRELLDSIQLKLQTTDVELESAAVDLKSHSSVDDAASGGTDKLESRDSMKGLQELLLGGGGECGDSVLCVDSMHISSDENLCTVHMAVQDTRPLSVYADVASQTIVLMVKRGGNNNAALQPRASENETVEYRIPLPIYCVLASVTDAKYSVSPFSVNLDGSQFETAEGSTGAEEMMVATEEQVSGADSGIMSRTSDLDLASNKDLADEKTEEKSEEESSTLAEATATEEGRATEGTGETGAREGALHDTVEESQNSKEAGMVQYQHARIQFKPLPKEAIRVSLQMLPQKQLSS
ncbi:uncharacterized protein LOC34619922 [Cyclospora cayetanensis]|uniref:Uncharacterized protein LOC34619922 n=1 Tax=Cyclospora cayetanensis TaxID=88456 RepID=A0A6P6RQQ9_9EIME|nr:uncharacterized protein LOC34619922 [Cyclospora cayetanensis]